MIRQTSRPWKKLKQMVRRSRKLGWSYMLDRLWLGAYSRLQLRARAMQVLEYREVQAARSFEPSCPVYHMPEINDPRTIEMVSAARPDLVVVLGTDILREPLLSAAPRFVNVHAGITPLYRGSHGQFWAVMNGELNQVGVTLHVVDSGIDTGAILGQSRFEVDAARDNFLSLAAKSSFHGARLLVDWIANQNGEFGTVEPLPPPPGKSHLYHSPGFRDHRKFEHLLRERKVA